MEVTAALEILAELIVKLRNEKAALVAEIASLKEKLEELDG